MYLSWAVLYEGVSDQAYLDILLPRLVEDLVSRHATRNVDIPLTPAIKLRRSTRDEVAAEICESRDAFEVLFVHADTGGRGVSSTLEDRSDAYCRAANERCGWPVDRCVTISPKHEIEAWLLADHVAVQGALGHRGDPAALGLPINAREAERIVDPKATMENAIRLLRGRRRTVDVLQLYPAIAQRQRSDALRHSESFEKFEQRLATCLQAVGCIRI